MEAPGYLHLVVGQVERHAAFDRLAPLEVANKAKHGEERDDDDHADVEHAERLAEVVWVLHLVLQWQHQRDALEREDGGAEEQRQLVEPSDEVALGRRGQVLQCVVERDADAERHEDHGGHRAVGEELELGDDGGEHDRHEQQRHVQVDVQHEPVLVGDLLEVGADEHEMQQKPSCVTQMNRLTAARIAGAQRRTDGGPYSKHSPTVSAKSGGLALRLLLALPLRHQVGAVHQHALAVHAHEAEEDGQQRGHQQAAIFERVAHRVAARADVALEQVHHRLGVARLVVRLDALHRDHVLRVVVAGPLAMVVVVHVVPPVPLDSLRRQLAHRHVVVLQAVVVLPGPEHAQRPVLIEPSQ
uniref:Uncharacterized protein n=1 Tax=Anopheles atroparvus TaxID=41427 RepID=A0A182J0M7_ANOAO